MLDIELELSALYFYLDLLEGFIRNKTAFENSSFKKRMRELKLTTDDPDWQTERAIFSELVDFLIPKLFRSSFLVSLYAVYESAITEIAELLQVKQGIIISINDTNINRNNSRISFLKKAKEYYKQIIDFPLYSNNIQWERITMLAELRHAIAHQNGRINTLSVKRKDKINRWEKKNIGISYINGYIFLMSDF